MFEQHLAKTSFFVVLFVENNLQNQEIFNTTDAHGKAT
jgi:hypothetical protein